MGLDSRWFKEDRKLPKEEQDAAKAATTKALKNSTLMTRRLGIILEDMLEATLRNDEDFEKPEYETRSIANASRRKTIREIKNLLP